MTTIREILNDKGPIVVSIQENSHLLEAIDRLNEFSIGCLVVMNAQGRMTGVLTERDILRNLHRYGKTLDEVPVSDVMNRIVYTGRLDDNLDAVMATMTERRFRHLPVVDHNELVGLISIGDVVKRLSHEHARENAILKDYISSPYPA